MRREYTPINDTELSELVSLLSKLVSLLSKFVLHTIDTLRLIAIIQAWLGSIGLKILLQSDAHLGMKTSLETKIQISTYMILASLAAGVTTKMLKHTRIPETQDHLFAASIGPMLYLISTLASYIGESSPWYFWPVTAAVATVSGVSMKYAISDSHSVGSEPAEYSTYTLARAEADRGSAWKHHLACTLSGITYGTSGLLLAWCIERELQGETVPLKVWEYMVAGALPIGVYAALGYKYAANEASSVFNRAVSFSKFIRDSAYTYAGLSGITLSVLTLANRSQYAEEYGNYLVFPYTALSLLSGAYSAATTFFRHEEVYNANRTTLDIPGAIKNAVSNCCASMFGYCRRASTSTEENLESGHATELRESDQLIPY